MDIARAFDEVAAGGAEPVEPFQPARRVAETLVQRLRAGLDDDAAVRGSRRKLAALRTARSQRVGSFSSSSIARHFTGTSMASMTEISLCTLLIARSISRPRVWSSWSLGVYSVSALRRFS
ncbi:hypothetical protein AB0I07_01520 [Polymorphospora rubra]